MRETASDTDVASGRPRHSLPMPSDPEPVPVVLLRPDPISSPIRCIISGGVRTYIDRSLQILSEVDDTD
jgi:hypothetical protein